MKLRSRINLDQRLKAKTVLQELGSEQKTVAESLDFFEPGDLQLLEKIALNPYGEVRDVRSALALPGLLLPTAVTGDKFREKRQEYMDSKRILFESWEQFNGAYYEERQHLADLLKEAEEIFLFRSLLSSELVTPNEEAWMVIQRKVREFAAKPKANPTSWLVKLMYVDPIRFRGLPTGELQDLCLQDIAQERQEYPLSKDKRQIRLLHALSATRLMFPELVDSSSLATEERAVTRTYLESRRAYARDEEGSDFAFYFYLLSIVEAPGLKVDEAGVHLFGSKDRGSKSPDLPQRIHI